MKDRAGSHRGLAAARHAFPVLGRGPPRVLTAAHWAPKALWPAQTSQILRARPVVGKPRPELLKRPRIVHPAHRTHTSKHHLNSIGPLKQISSTYVHRIAVRGFEEGIQRRCS